MHTCAFVLPYGTCTHMCIYTSLWHLHTCAFILLMTLAQYVHLYFFMAPTHVCAFILLYGTCTHMCIYTSYGTCSHMCIYASLWHLHTHVHLYFLWHLYMYVHLYFFMAPAHICDSYVVFTILLLSVRGRIADAFCLHSESGLTNSIYISSFRC